ncbi:tetratricopeptide repeat protein [Variovorax sp. J31P207]|uniref:O-linked N-acetylglucosamine transferase family protein n=1 Tax=Variovorax sp. J31P207 TaxID=3053510 RepID=UPI0025787536|nr:tetratricopeptide repeat protein [Variovorax sp. J31P207]MDM0070930.1 tetratricopeptide repeat protein [Variovorax sp. J31P207]
MNAFPASQQPDGPSDTPVLDALAHALDESLRMATDFHRGGQLEHAETLYRGILDALPQHAQANYGLGRLAVRAGQASAALPHFVAALKAQPDNPKYQLGCIDALMQADQIDAARDMLESALQDGLQGELAEALARQLEVRTRIARSIRDTQAPATLAPAPRVPAAPGLVSRTAQPSPRELGQLTTHFARKRYEKVKTLARSLTQRFPRHPAAWKAWGVALCAEGDPRGALQPLEKAASLLPQDAEAQFNLGVTLAAVGRYDEAEPTLRRVLEIDPMHAKAHSTLGWMLQGQTRLFEAELHCRRALEIDPAYVDAHLELGGVLKHMRRLGEAEASYRKALDIDPAKATGHNQLGLLLLEQDRSADAEAAFRRAVAANPALGYLFANLGASLSAQGRQAEAEASFRRALQIQPDETNSHSALLFSLTHGQTLDADAVFAEHRRFGERFEMPLRAAWRPHDRSREPGRPLQIGFVSGDLYNHAVASFLEPVLAHLAGEPSLVLHAYSTRRAAEDHVSQRLRGHVNSWHTVGGLGDAELAEKIRADGIDILIDLSGHTADNRLPVFARRPAPVQVTWMGYPGTTGLESMDYYLADPFILPPGRFDGQFTEKLAYLPANAPFQPSAEAPPVNDLPALRAGHLTFGSFNRLNKISREVVALWSRLLRAVPMSRMLLAGLPRHGEYEALIGWFDGEGIERSRLDFHQRSAMSHYLALHHQVDVCLDTFPYNGGTTSLHAVWMGVPTLTLAGATMAGRAGASLLGHVGLDEFVVQDASAFEAQGASLAQRLPELAQLRASLRGRLADSAIGQPSLIAAALERALRTMWRRWCAGLPAASFDAGRGLGGRA